MTIKRRSGGKKASAPAPLPIPGSALRFDQRSLSEEAYEHIKRLILSGVFKDGEKIPEEKIAQILNVSRTPIREALRQLEQYGLVVIKPRSYAKVASVTFREAEQVAHVRLELEKLAVRSIVKTVVKDDLDALARIARQAVAKFREGSLAETFMLDSAFHLELVRRSGNNILYDILERLDAKNQLVRVRSVAARPAEMVERLLREHQAWVTMLANGDEEGLMRAVEAHIIPGN